MDDTTLERRLHSARRWNHALLAICILNAAAAGWAIYALRAQRTDSGDTLRTRRLILQDSGTDGQATLELAGSALSFELGDDDGRPEAVLARNESGVALTLQAADKASTAISATGTGGGLVIGGGSSGIALSVDESMIKLFGDVPGPKLATGMHLTVRRGFSHLRIFSDLNLVDVTAQEGGATVKEHTGAAAPEPQP